MAGHIAIRSSLENAVFSDSPIQLLSKNHVNNNSDDVYYLLPVCMGWAFSLYFVFFPFVFKCLFAQLDNYIQEGVSPIL